MQKAVRFGSRSPCLPAYVANHSEKENLNETLPYTIENEARFSDKLPHGPDFHKEAIFQ